MSKLVLWTILILSLLAAPIRAQEPDRRMNILMIAVDDLRPELACYGQKQIVSPNIDGLARSGVLFERAYCQQAVCAPSRVSLMTGCRPDTTRVKNLDTPLPTVRPDLVTLPQYLKGKGYQTVSLGKIYHHGAADDPKGWSIPPWRPGGGTYASEEKKAEFQKLAAQDRRPAPVEAADLPDSAYPDGKIAARAIEELRRLKEGPFFLAVGFMKPHLPFAAPKRAWDLYDRSTIDLADNPFAPKGMPDVAKTNWGELRKYAGMPENGPVTDDQARELIHGYYACVSHTDRQVGKVLAELDRLGLRDNTVIVLWGDHGWQLGDHGMWCKHTNFEVATRAPLIFSGPGVPRGTRTSALAEFVDVYPTLCDLAGAGVPEGLEGMSLGPVLTDPAKPWKRAAFSQYAHEGRMGYTVTDGRWRFTEWEAGRRDAKEEFELYDHQSDPKENENLAYQDQFAADRARMEKLLAGGWKAARP